MNIGDTLIHDLFDLVRQDAIFLGIADFLGD
jgi:hypothetical protein